MQSLPVRLQKKKKKKKNVTLTTMPIIRIGIKTICQFPICGGADIMSRLCFASLIISYRIGDINDIKTTKTLSKISSLLRWIMHQSFVTTAPPPTIHTQTHTNGEQRGQRLFIHHSPGTC